MEVYADKEQFDNFDLRVALEDRRFETVFQNQTYYFPIPEKYDLRFKAQSSSAGVDISFPYTLFLVPIAYWKPQSLIGDYIVNGIIED